MQQAFHGELPCFEILLALTNATANARGAIRNKAAHNAAWYASC